MEDTTQGGPSLSFFRDDPSPSPAGDFRFVPDVFLPAGAGFGMGNAKAGVVLLARDLVTIGDAGNGLRERDLRWRCPTSSLGLSRRLPAAAVIVSCDPCGVAAMMLTTGVAASCMGMIVGSAVAAAGGSGIVEVS